MKKLIVIIFVLCFTVPSFAGDKLRYNGYEDRYEYADEKDTLRYNGYENRYEYAAPDRPEPKKEIIKEPEEPVRYSRKIPCLGCKPGENSDFYVHPQPVYRTWGNEEE